MLSSLQKAGGVLDLFDRAHPELGVTEVARALGVSKSTAYELLATLASMGLLRRTADSRYRLGWKLLTLSETLINSTECRVEAREVIQQLNQRFGETVHLAMLDGDTVVYVDRVQGTQAIQIAATTIGSRLPAHCSGVGKVLLAWRPWSEVEGILGRAGMRAITSRTITDPVALRRELQLVAQRGHAFDHEETMRDLCCVAAPIRDFTEQVIAALSLSVPTYRFGRHRAAYTTAILQAAHEISTKLGYLPQARRPGRPKCQHWSLGVRI